MSMSIMSSWYEDPQLFICNAGSRALHGFNVYRCKKELGGPIRDSDLPRVSSGVKKQRDFDELLAHLIDFYIRSGSKIWRLVNCQGLAIIWDESTHGKIICSWSREPLDSPYYNLPGITPPVDDEKEALRIRVSDLESRISTLEADVQRERDEKQGLENQVFDLTSTLETCWGAGVTAEPWMSGNRIVPNTWVPFEDLDVHNIPTNLKIIKALSAMRFVEDNTTNVKASHFYGGLYPVVAVNVDELIPDNDEARFDPSIWGLYKNAGMSYAARKLFAPEM